MSGVRYLVTSRGSVLQQPNDNLWKFFLEAVSRSTQVDNSVILLLGKRDVGKTTLIQQLQNISSEGAKLTPVELYNDQFGVTGLSYASISVRDIDDTDLVETPAKLDLWIVQYPQPKFLLPHILTPEMLEHMLILICLDLTEPWTILDQLKEWLTFASDILQDLFTKLPFEKQEILRAKLYDYLCQYRSKLTGEPPLDYSLKINFGVPFVVSVLKADATACLDTRNFPGRADAILAYLRAACFPYGAALCYCCTKANVSQQNVNTLFDYIIHRLYDVKFEKPLKLSPPEAIFVPSGWDSQPDITKFSEKTLAGDMQMPLQSLLPSALGEDVEGVIATKVEAETTVDVPKFEDFLERLLNANPSLGQGAATAPAVDTSSATMEGGEESRTGVGTVEAKGSSRRSIVSLPSTSRNLQFPQKESVATKPSRRSSQLNKH